MAQIAIQRCKDLEATPQTLLEKTEGVMESIRKRAFELFEGRNSTDGQDVEDWLKAERDVVWWPASELVENDKEVIARVEVPGSDAKEIEISVLPDALIVQAASRHREERKNGNVCFSEFSEKELFRLFPLPAAVDVEKVSAFLDKGILTITAPKVAAKAAAA
jgi:HSP20 family protein